MSPNNQPVAFTLDDSNRIQRIETLLEQHLKGAEVRTAKIEEKFSEYDGLVSKAKGAAWLFGILVAGFEIVWHKLKG